MNGPGSIRIEERGPRASSFGEVLQLKVWAPGGRPLFWREIEDAFNAAYPGRWAIQLFPPKELIVDGSNIYHLEVLPEPPVGLDLREGERSFAEARARAVAARAPAAPIAPPAPPVGPPDPRPGDARGIPGGAA